MSSAKSTALTVVKPTKKREWPHGTLSEAIRKADKPGRSAAEVAEELGCDQHDVWGVRSRDKAKEGKGNGGALVVNGKRGRLSADDGVTVETTIRRDGAPLLMMAGTPEVLALVQSDIVTKLRRAHQK